MPVIETHLEYLTILTEYRAAPEWQKDLLLRGTLLEKCVTLKPADARRRLRQFWGTETAKRGMKPQELQTWV